MGRQREDVWWCTECRGPVAVVVGGPVPVCAGCGALPLRRTRGEHGAVAWEQPAPQYCTGAQRHRLLPGRVKVGYRTCRCSAPGDGHSTWTCTDCNPWSEQEAPECALPPAERERLIAGGAPPRIASALAAEVIDRAFPASP